MSNSSLVSLANPHRSPSTHERKGLGEVKYPTYTLGARRRIPATASVRPVASSIQESGSGTVTLPRGTATEELSWSVVPESAPMLFVDWLVKWPARLIPLSLDTIEKPVKFASPATTGPVYENVTFISVGSSNADPLMVEGVIPDNCSETVHPGVDTEAETNPGISQIGKNVPVGLHWTRVLLGPGQVTPLVAAGSSRSSALTVAE